jgi:hypothetical protein
VNNQEDVVKSGNVDMNLFFHDAEFESKYPGVKAPPPCFIASGAKIIAYEPNKSLTVAFPIREDQTNPVGSLRAGSSPVFLTIPSVRSPSGPRENPAYPSI